MGRVGEGLCCLSLVIHSGLEAVDEALEVVNLCAVVVGAGGTLGGLETVHLGV